ncbi:hypothetical protein G6F59_018681 [Rhizopus arrhizus]|nr:hypothetical protein G6F59_018681 [Rhizopus arrhizus]
MPQAGTGPGESIQFRVHTGATGATRPAATASRPAHARATASHPQEGVTPHERFVLHPQPAERRRQDLRLLQPAHAGPALRYLPPALLDEDPAGEPAPA